MPIAIRRIRSVWTPKLDGSEVFYAPLWRPDLSGSPFKTLDRSGISCSVTGALWTPQGRTFDGTDDYINCGDDTSLDITSAITLEAWVNITAPITDRAIITRDDGTNRNYWLVGDGNTIRMFVVIGGVLKQVISSAITASTWYHAVGTYDGTNVNLYVDTVAQTPTAATGAIDNDDVSLMVGIRAVTLDRDFAGTIGEVRIYNRALGLAEIQRNYQTAKWRY